MAERTTRASAGSGSRRVLLVGLALGAVALALLALGRAAGTRQKDDLDGVETARVSRRDIGNVVKATGVVKPRTGAEVRVGSRISGVVTRLHVRVGDVVRAGQLLAEIDDRELAARQREAAAAVELAAANLTYAEADLRRRRELAEGGVLAPSELELASTARTVAAQRVAQARASLDSAQAQLGYARVLAPIGGVVASVSTREGETVAASFAAPTFVTLLDLSRLEVWAYVDETDIGRVVVGQPARFTVDTYGDTEIAGEVTAVYPQAEIRDNVVDYVAVVTFEPPRAGGPRPQMVLRPEMTATVRIALPAKEDVLALPLRAVRRENGRPYVVLVRGGALERRAVTTGSRDDSHWEVVAGVREGDLVRIGDLGKEEVRNHP